MRALRWLSVLALAVISAFWFFMIAVPVAAVLGHAGSGGSLLDPVLLAIARFTFLQALVSTLLSAGLGFGLGVFFHRHGAGKWVEALLGIPFGVPTVVAAFAWVALLGRSGILAGYGIHLDWAYSVRAVVLAHVFFNLPWIALLTLQACGSVPKSEWDAAENLGAGVVSQVRWILWPRVKGTLAAAVAQVFAFCAMSFSIVLVLGGGPPVQTLETELYSRVRYSGLDLGGASGAAFWQLLMTLPVWAVAAWKTTGESDLPAESDQGSGSGPGFGMTPSFRARAGSSKRFLFLAAGVFILPYFSVLFPLRWASLFFDSATAAETWRAFFSSLELSLASGLLSVFLALVSVFAISGMAGKTGRKKNLWVQRSLLILLGVPAGISVLVLGLGFWIAYSRWVDPFDGSFPAIVLLQSTLFLPFALKMLWPLAQMRQTRLLGAAETLGASPLRAFWEIERPRWQLAVLSAFGFATAAALSEVGAVSLFFSEKLLPLSLLAIRWGSQYRFEQARSVAGLLFVLSGGVIVLAVLGGRRLGNRWA